MKALWTGDKVTSRVGEFAVAFRTRREVFQEVNLNEKGRGFRSDYY